MRKGISRMLGLLENGAAVLLLSAVVSVSGCVDLAGSEDEIEAHHRAFTVDAGDCETKGQTEVLSDQLVAGFRTGYMARKNHWVVADIAADSVRKAGVQKGDVLLSVNGIPRPTVPTHAATLEELPRPSFVKKGPTAQYKFERDGAEFEVTLPVRPASEIQGMQGCCAGCDCGGGCTGLYGWMCYFFPDQPGLCALCSPP